MLSEKCVKQRIKEFIAKSEFSVAVISVTVGEAFAEIFNSAEVKAEIIYLDPEKIKNAPKFPNISCVVVDRKEAMIITGPLEDRSWLRVATEIRKMEEIQRIFSELKEIFYIEL